MVADRSICWRRPASGLQCDFQDMVGGGPGHRAQKGREGGKSDDRSCAVGAGVTGGQTRALGTLSTVDFAVAGHTSPWVEAEHP